MPVRSALLLGAVLLPGLVSPANAGTVWPTNGWAVSTPESEGMNAALVTQARDHALSGNGSGMITRHGNVVMSWGNTGTRYGVKSTTKSIGVTLLGIALGDGLVAATDSASTHLPEFGTPPSSNTATGWLPDITLRHVATHSAGFDVAGGYVGLRSAPGTEWRYSNGGANWLADVLTVSFGSDLNDVMFTRVLNTLGVTTSHFEWRSNSYRSDTIQGIKRREFGSGVSLSVDAMARIGYLYLRNGSWDGTSILPAAFVLQVRQPDTALPVMTLVDPSRFPGATSHYGLLWWNNGDGSIANVPTDAYWSWGLGESLIVVIPSLDIVASRAGDAWRAGWDADYSVLAPFLQPLAQSVQPTPVEPDSWAGIKARYR